MSFILDALKKSEIERQRQSVPGFIDVPVATPRRAIPLWVWLVSLLLAINIAVLLVFLFRSSPSGTSRTSLAAGTSARENQRGDPPAKPTPKAAAEDADHFSPLDNPTVYAPEIPVQEESAPRRSTASGMVPELAPPLRPETSRSDTALRPETSRSDTPLRASRRADPILNEEPPDNEEMLPSLSELNLTGTQSLPEIHLDVHVYATRSADRFVYINMRKYREGAVLQEGPVLERIRRDGVVLNSNGLRFFVPRQS